MSSKKINEEIAKLRSTGGRVYLPCREYKLSETLKIESPCIKLCGEAWNYSSDPNGVFPSPYGTKLRVLTDLPAISVAENGLAAGVVVTDIGICGNAEGMDTVPLLLPDKTKNSGLAFVGERVDQGEFSKLSFCGLGVAVCVTGKAELDACSFEKLNTDGCCIGVYFKPKASYYTYFRKCVIADTPSYGFYANGKDSDVRDLDVSDNCFVRNCGAMPGGQEDTAAAVFFDNVNNCSVRNNRIDGAGTFWYYDKNAKENDERQIFFAPAAGIYIIGDKNRITGNIISGCKGNSITVKGNRNVLMNNITDKDVVIDGENNVVNGLIFTELSAKLILLEKAASTTEIIGVNEERIVRQNKTKSIKR